MKSSKRITNLMKVFLLGSAIFITIKSDAYGMEDVSQSYSQMQVITLKQGESPANYRLRVQDILNKLPSGHPCKKINLQQAPNAIKLAIESCNAQIVQQQAEQARKAEELRKRKEEYEAEQKRLREQHEQALLLEQEKVRRAEEEKLRIEEERLRLAEERDALKQQLSESDIRNLEFLVSTSGGFLEALQALIFESNKERVRKGIQKNTGYLGRFIGYSDSHMKRITDDLAINHPLGEFLRLPKKIEISGEMRKKYQLSKERIKGLIDAALESIGRVLSLVKDRPELQEESTFEAAAYILSFKDEITRLPAEKMHSYLEENNKILEALQTLLCIDKIATADEFSYEKWGDLTQQNTISDLANRKVDINFLKNNENNFLYPKGNYEDYINIFKLYYFIKKYDVPAEVENPVANVLKKLKVPLEEIDNDKKLLEEEVTNEVASNFYKFISVYKFNSIREIVKFQKNHEDKIAVANNEFLGIFQELFVKPFDHLKAAYRADNKTIALVYPIAKDKPGNKGENVDIFTKPLSAAIAIIKQETTKHIEKALFSSFSMEETIRGLEKKVDEVTLNEDLKGAFLRKVEDVIVKLSINKAIQPYSENDYQLVTRILDAKIQYDNLIKTAQGLKEIKPINEQTELQKNFNKIAELYNESLSSGDYMNVLALKAQDRSSLFSHYIPMFWDEFPLPQDIGNWRGISEENQRSFREFYEAYLTLRTSLSKVNLVKPELAGDAYLDIIEDVADLSPIELGGNNLVVPRGGGAPPPPPGPGAPPPPPGPGGKVQIDPTLVAAQEKLYTFLEKIQKWNTIDKKAIVSEFYKNLYARLTNFYTHLGETYPTVGEVKESLFSIMSKDLDEATAHETEEKFNLLREDTKKAYREQFEAALEGQVDFPKSSAIYARLKAERFPSKNPSGLDGKKISSTSKKPGTAIISEDVILNITSELDKISSAELKEKAGEMLSTGRYTYTDPKTIPVNTSVQDVEEFKNISKKIAEAQARGEFQSRGIEIEKVSLEEINLAGQLVEDIANPGQVISVETLEKIKGLPNQMQSKSTLMEWAIYDIYEKSRAKDKISLSRIDPQWNDLILGWEIAIKENDQETLKGLWNKYRASDKEVVRVPNSVYNVLAFLLFKDIHEITTLAEARWEARHKLYLDYYFDKIPALEPLDSSEEKFLDAIKGLQSFG